MVLMMGFIITSEWGSFSLFQKSPFLVDAPPFLGRHVFLSMLPNRDFPWWQQCWSKVGARRKRGHYCLKTWGSHHFARGCVTDKDKCLQAIPDFCSGIFNDGILHSKMSNGFHNEKNECLIWAWKLRMIRTLCVPFPIFLLLLLLYWIVCSLTLYELQMWYF